jgi:leucyl/phenylalanyl-tRNA---protein transferase
VELNIGKYHFPHPAGMPGDEPVAIGGDLLPQTLLDAYAHGFFPWHTGAYGPCWYHPDPRMVLFPHKLKVQKSMRPYLNGKHFSWKMNTRFSEVLDQCTQVPRSGQGGTWIWPEYVEAMNEMHRLGHAFSFETYCNNKLAGGLYGLYIKGIFFGESMFSLESNASKYAFIQMVRNLKGLRLVDCQTPGEHLATMGAEIISRDDFIRLL